MPNRETHVFFSKLLHPEMSTRLIDGVSKQMDAPAKQMGPYHRKVLHSKNPFSMNSVPVHKGDPKKFMLQQEHILLDENPELASLVEQMQVAEKWKRKANSQYYRRMRK